MALFRRGRRSLERELRALAPEPRPEFLAETTRLVRAHSPRTVRESRFRAGVAVALTAVLAAAVAALGAPSYVRAAASAVVSTAKATIVATAQLSSQSSNGNGNNGNGNGDNNGNGNGGDNGNGNGGNDNDGDNDNGNNGNDNDNDKGDESGEKQYGHGKPICHKTGSDTNPFVLIVVPESALPAHQAHGDIIPAPKDGCPKKEKKDKDKEKKTHTDVHGPDKQPHAGDEVSFAVSVAADDGTTPQGAIECYDGDTEFDAAAIVNGAATCTEKVGTAGDHVITVTYSTADYSAWSSSSSTAVTVAVVPAAASVTLASSGTPSAAGAPVTFTATVAPAETGGAAPTGTVTFLDGTTPVGSATVSGGTATLGSSTLTSGAHAITAVYAGDSTYGIATSPPVTQVVSTASTSITLSSSANPSTAGASVTITATVAAPGGSAPAGTVTFLDGTTTLGSADTDASGKASLAATLSSVGPHSITASFATKDATKWASSTGGSLTQTVDKAAATVSLGSSANPATPGGTVTFTASVSGAAGTPTGTVTFLDGTTVLGSAPLSGGTASLAVSTLSVATHSITASYGGGGAYAAATSAVLAQSVKAAATSLSYTGAASGTSGQQLSLSAALTGGPAGASVTFTYPGGSTSAAAGASVSITPSWLGPATITASYAGDSAHVASTTSATVTVSAPTSLTLTSSPNPSTAGQSVQLSATLSVTGAPLPPGSILVFSDSTTTLGSAAVDGSGKAGLTVGTLAAGPHSLSVSYAGNANLYVLPSSSSLTQTVNGLATSLAYTGPAKVSVGVGTTFTAQATGIPNGGSVVFTFPDGSTATGTVSSGSVSVTKTVSWTPNAGTTLTLRYGGDATYASSSATGTVTIDQHLVAVTVSSSSNPVATPQSVTYTATVAPADGTDAKGTLTIYDTGVVLDSGKVKKGNQSLTVTVPALPVGTHSITATFVSDDTTQWANGTSAVYSQTVTKPAVTIALATSAASVYPGSPVTFTATVAPLVKALASPTGTVQFLDGSTVLGSGTLSGGVATFATSSLALGSHSITAVYAGDALYDKATSAMVAETVNGLPTSLAYTGPAKVSVGVSTTFTAQATGIPNGASIVFTFPDGTTASGTVSSGAASVTKTVGWTPLNGTTVTVSYAGDSTHASASATGTVAIDQHLVSVTISSSANPVGMLQPVTYTATVAAADGTKAAGTLTIYDGGVSIGSGSVGSASQSVTATGNALLPGTRSITASFASSDTTKWASASSSTFTETISKPGVTVTLATSAATVTSGTSVTFTATVLPVVHALVVPTGSVQFLDGTTVLGTGTLSSGGAASFSTSALAVGSHSVTVSYGGDTLYATGASSVVTETVNAASNGDNGNGGGNGNGKKP